MRLGLLGSCGLAFLGACGGTRPSGPPVPVPGSEPAAIPPSSSGALRYRLRGPVAYEIERYDSLFYASMPGAPQATSKRGVLTVRPLPGRSGEVEVRLDSLIGLEDTRLSSAGIDSTIGSRWQLTLGAEGPKGVLAGGRPTILAGQVEALIRLLFPLLPIHGLQAQGTWTDSSGYHLRLDAFDSFESAARTSQAVPTSGFTHDAESVTVEAAERLSRSGTATQAGQPMRLSGAGLRRLRYEFSPGGWVGHLEARDSLDLVVTVGQGGQAVAVRWRSTLVGRLRDLPLR